MKHRLQIWICIIYFIFVFKQSLGRPLLGLDDLNILQNITSFLNFNNGSSKLEIFELLSTNFLNLSTPDGGIIMEGDTVQYHFDAKGKKDDGDLWPDAVIPYMFHESVDTLHKNLVKQAMRHWEENTCIKFKKRQKKDKHYLRFRTDTSGCWSAVGRQYDKPGPQDISFGEGCFKFYTAIHEIGHTIGYYHEHSRQDRDKFVEIMWDNVKPGMKVQFQLKNTRNEGFEYDYLSIMHYPAWAFSKTPLKANVVLSKNPFSQYQIDEEKNTISFREKCLSSERDMCKNGGVLVPAKSTGKECTCICPPGFEGIWCQQIEAKKKIDPRQPKCGGNVTVEGIISTPNYPKRKEEFESCSYWIKAPIDHRVRFTFLDFSFAEPYGGDKSGAEGLCLYENVEIRKLENIYKGSIYCGEQIAKNTVMESKERDFIIIIIADDQKKGRGLNGRVEFIKGPGQLSPVQFKNEVFTKNTRSEGLLGGVLI